MKKSAKKSLLLGSLAVLGCVLGYGPASGQQRNTAAPTLPVAKQRALLDQYCVSCHNQRLKSGGIQLDDVDLSKLGDHAELGERIVRRLRAGVMPPLNMPRPDVATYESLTVSLETALDKASAARPNPAPPGVHRMNRAEYSNAVREMLALEVDASGLLPVDDSSAGFDNVASSLSVSPALVEGYMSAAGKISRLALGLELAPNEKKYIPAADYSQENHVEGLPFGTRGGMVVKHYFPADGEYTINWAPVRSNTGALTGRDKKGEQVEVTIDGERVKLFDFDKEVIPTSNDDNHETRVTVKAGLRTVGVTFIDTNKVPNDDLNMHFIRSLLDTGNVGGYTWSPHISAVTIAGPYDGKVPESTPSRKKILVCTPADDADEVPCAKKIISNLARQAFRRPATDADVEALLSFYQSGRNKGSFERGIQEALQAVLSDPEFVFRSEADPGDNVKPGQAYRISDLELASRLSFFLWSAPPDEQLIALASQNKLRDPKVLEQQTRRLLTDPRSKALVENFAGQWLQLRNLASSAPVVTAFPNFDDNLRTAFKTETELFFDSIVREDRSIVDLLNADYTFVNERLARHYGIPNVYGSQFRRITLSKEFDVRRGILGQGSILLVTALADRTSPVQRGKWVLMNILGVIPPDPPPNVPPLKESDKQANGLAVALEQTMRQRMEEHRPNPVCASCHLKMDPIGFTLENFDAIGYWRDTQFGQKIDASGVIADGTKLDGPASLRNAMLRYSPQFVRVVTEKLLVYALGRGTDYYDMPVVRSIVRDAQKNNYKFSSVILGIVKSTPFQMSVKPLDTVAVR